MSSQRTLYSPRLENDLVRRLYREGRRQGRPMTLVLDQIVRAALPEEEPALAPVPGVADNTVPYRANRDNSAA